MELTLVPTAYDVSSEPSSEVEANNEPDTGSTSLSLHETTASSVSDSATDTAGESTDEAAPAIKAEDSIEACMAKLLSRTRGTEVSENDVKSLTAAAASAAVALRESDASNSESSARNAPFDPADRSHLKAEPKHKQDRQAARDDLQSFRQVAHQSARSALARHTSKALLSAMIAKSLLLGVSVLATTVFLGVPLMGMPTQIWKGVACSLATLLSAIEVYRSWRQLHCWKGAGELPKKNATIPVASPAPASESAASEEKAVEIPAAAITK